MNNERHQTINNTDQVMTLDHNGEALRQKDQQANGNSPNQNLIPYDPSMNPIPSDPNPTQYDPTMWPRANPDSNPHGPAESQESPTHLNPESTPFKPQDVPMDPKPEATQSFSLPYAGNDTQITKWGAGLDLFTAKTVTIPRFSIQRVNTTLQVKLPDSTAALVLARSHLSQHNLTIPLGLIDPGYTAKIVMQVHNHNNHPVRIPKGERIGQLLILQLPNFTLELTQQDFQNREASRKGFGSTGHTEILRLSRFTNKK